MITRQNIEQAAQMYKMKDYVLKAKERSTDTYNTIRTLLINYSEINKKPMLESAIDIAKDEEPMMIIWIMGMAAVLIEDEKL